MQNHTKHLLTGQVLQKQAANGKGADNNAEV